MIKSPSYPSLSLEDAISGVGKIESVYRRSLAERSDAAKLMGFSSLSGPANKALAALTSYGLLETSGKGMVRVTPLAISLLHPKTERERRESIMAAADAPTLFRDIKKHFPDHCVPPEGGVISYLNRAGFNPTAVPKAAKAYRDTAAFVEKWPVIESRGVDEAAAPESVVPVREGSMNGTSAGATMEQDTLERPRSDARREDDPRRDAAELNKIKTQFDNETVRITALLDRDGIRQLERRLKAIKLMLDIDDDDPHQE